MNGRAPSTCVSLPATNTTNYYSFVHHLLPLHLYTPVVSTRQLPDLTTHGYVLSPAAKPACTTLMRVSVCGARELCHNEQSRGGKGLPPPFFFIWSFCTRSEHDHNNILKQHACLHYGRLVSGPEDARSTGMMMTRLRGSGSWQVVIEYLCKKY